MERKVLLWLFNYGVFKNILCVFQTWKWSTITEGENKGKRRMWRLNYLRWGRRHPLLLFLFVFQYLHVYVYFFYLISWIFLFISRCTLCFLWIYVNIYLINLPSYFCNAHFDVHSLPFSLPEAGNTQQKYNFDCFKVFSNRSVLGKNYYYLPAWRQWDVKKMQRFT